MFLVLVPGALTQQYVFRCRFYMKNGLVELQHGQLFICKEVISLQVHTKGTREEAAHCFTLQE